MATTGQQAPWTETEIDDYRIVATSEGRISVGEAFSRIKLPEEYTMSHAHPGSGSTTIGFYAESRLAGLNHKDEVLSLIPDYLFPFVCKLTFSSCEVRERQWCSYTLYFRQPMVDPRCVPVPTCVQTRCSRSIKEQDTGRDHHDA